MTRRADMEPLTKGEKRYLSRHYCRLCETPLDRDGCGANFGKCTPELRADRRKRCLAGYKPRKTKVPA